MKKVIHTLLLLMLGLGIQAQRLNWSTIDSSKHFINAFVGSEYSLISGLSYAYKLPTKLPILLNVEYSFPFGNKHIDDFKSKIGCQIKWYTYKNFSVSTNIQGLFRRYQNNLVRIENFGSDFSLDAGYYKPKWYVSLFTGFDKAIVSNFKHSKKYLEIYPDVKNGWYEPATGGNFYYGLSAGTKIYKATAVYLDAGKILTQDFKTGPSFPFYLKLGASISF
jgi:hypothetical protein